MSYRFEPGHVYRMPTHFGPVPGPRQQPDGFARDWKHSPRTLTVSASYLTDAARLERHLPEGFALAGEPVVTVDFHYMTGIDWLAGRGYNMIFLTWPAAFKGRQDKATGKFLSVIWENLADPIIAGRDEIGHPKLYAEIAEPRFWDGAQICSAGWMGFRFLDLTVSELRDAAPSSAKAHSDGTMMLKYVPRTGTKGEADVNQVTITPAEDPETSVERRQTGIGAVRFHRATVSDLPTMHHVVNALADLPIIEPRGGSLTHSHGSKWSRDQRVLA
jgi:acetoacetate decarboxylase